MKKLFLLLILSFFSAQNFAGSCPDGSEPTRSVSADGSYYEYKCSNDSNNTSTSSSSYSSSSLPNCSGEYWDNCFGERDYPNSDIYIGEWKDNKYHGQGTYYLNGISHNGLWTPDSGKYVGGFLFGKKYGQGTYELFSTHAGISTSGETYAKCTHTYVGKFKNDLRDGLGTQFFECNGVQEMEPKIGIWAKDNYLRPNKSAEYKIPDNNNVVPKPNNKTEESKPSSKDEVFSAASGSGFAVTSDGYVVTNYHVIDGCTDVKIHEKGKSILATVVTFDPLNDIALLKGDFKPKKFYPLSRKTPKLLTEIYVAGHPFGQDISTSVKVTKGIISSLSGVANNFSNLQIDAALQPGNSGGPIMNDKGNVIGVAVSKLDLETIVDDYGVVPENVNFGVKANVVVNILESENIQLPTPNAETISSSELGELITDGTYYLSCWMTLAQIKQMIETKVMFKDLK
jgi:S1-C subfamily serine protease